MSGTFLALTQFLTGKDLLDRRRVQSALYKHIDPTTNKGTETKKVKTNISNQHEEAFTMLRKSLGHLSLPLDLVDEVIERHMAVVYEKGALAFCEGNTDDMLACILSGYVFVYCPVGDGNRTLVQIAGPGEIIGYADYVDEKGRHARMFEAQVASKCTLALFSRDLITRRLADLPPDAVISILASLNTFWSENLRRFTTLLSLPLKDRLMIVMSELAKRTGVRDKEGIILIPEIGHEDLAEMIGCSRPMVTRMISEMMESRLLSRRGKQYVLLKKWDFNNNGHNPHKSNRRVKAVSGRRSSTFAVPAVSANGRAISYAAPGSGGR
ncbi:Crp/Fnr family transcriptional regulator [Candidatus Binatus sp.]|uniref:Crp/Fnr family transcriptional regulator n=1 Tax=Candidatus Binatus sp. TaxID=2811406 RepID=UPI003BC50D26